MSTKTLLSFVAALDLILVGANAMLFWLTGSILHLALGVILVASAAVAYLTLQRP